MKKIFAILMTLIMVLSMVACTSEPAEETTTEAPTEVTPAYADALAVMTAIWDAFPESEKFAAWGGNQNENAVMDAPGAFDLTDTDGLNRLILVPESVQGNLTSAATLVHMMNTNSFTGAVLELTEADENATKALVETITGNHFMCGFPEKLVIMTMGNYVIYAFGGETQVDTFCNAATTTLTETVSVVYNNWMM